MENDLTELDATRFVKAKSFNAKKYKGFKVKIAKVSKPEVTDWYTGTIDEKGKNTYNPQSTGKKRVVIIETAELPVLDAEGKPTSDLTGITVQRRFNLKKEVVNEKVEWVISQHDKADLWQFMKNLEVTKLSELIGKEVILTVEADKNKTDQFWLRISD